MTELDDLLGITYFQSNKNNKFLIAQARNEPQEIFFPGQLSLNFCSREQLY